jgi:hypothetical protein
MDPLAGVFIDEITQETVALIADGVAAMAEGFALA